MQLSQDSNCDFFWFLFKNFFPKYYSRCQTWGAAYLYVQLICWCIWYLKSIQPYTCFKNSTSHVKLTDCIIIIIKDVFLCVLSTYRKTSLERKIPTSVFLWLNTFRDHNWNLKTRLTTATLLSFQSSRENLIL